MASGLRREEKDVSKSVDKLLTKWKRNASGDRERRQNESGPRDDWYGQGCNHPSGRILPVEGRTRPPFPFGQTAHALSSLPPGRLPLRTFARTVSSELIGFCCTFFFFVYVPYTRLNWPIRQLLSARKYIVSYRIVFAPATPRCSCTPDKSPNSGNRIGTRKSSEISVKGCDNTDRFHFTIYYARSIYHP